MQINGKKELNDWNRWVDKFLSLRDYKAIYENIAVTKATGVGRFNNLHRWIIKQRIQHRDIDYHPVKVELLDTLSFNWKIASRYASAAATTAAIALTALRTSSHQVQQQFQDQDLLMSQPAFTKCRKFTLKMLSKRPLRNTATTWRKSFWEPSCMQIWKNQNTFGTS